MKMKYIDLKDKDIGSLSELLKEKRLLLFKLKAKLKTMQLNNPNEIREVKADIARIKTAQTALKNEVKVQ
jgi:large subunit ribosomal protein L29